MPRFTIQDDRAQPFDTMRILLVVVALVVVAVLAFADYKWRRWMADRHRERE